MTPSEQSYAEIALGENLFALVDQRDFERLSKVRWRPYRRANKVGVYAVSGVCVFMHRLLLGLQPRDGKLGDHINGNTLDNRRQNLRVATPAQNSQNRRCRRDSITGLKGVYPHRKRWQAAIVINGVKRYLGTFDSPELASAAYRDAAFKNFGDFARTD